MNEMSYQAYMKMTAEGRKKPGKGAHRDPFEMDLLVFNTDSQQIIHNCKGNVYGYVRVSIYVPLAIVDDRLRFGRDVFESGDWQNG